RDGNRDAEGFGHGEGYIYPHAYRNHWAAQQYLPTVLQGRTFYIPSAVGHEGKIREDVLRKRELQAAVVLGDGPEGAADDGELLTWSAASKGREGWFKRLESNRGALLLSDRNAIFNAASPARYGRTLIPLADDGLLLWESLRRCPEGLSAALVTSEQAREALYRYATALDHIEQPVIAVLDNGLLPTSSQAGEWFPSQQFDHILIREPWKRAGSFASGETFALLASGARSLLAPGGSLVLLCSPPGLGQRISGILRNDCGNECGDTLAEKLRQAEDSFFALPDTWNWDAAGLAAPFESQGFRVKTDLIDQQEERLIGSKDIDAWFDRKRSRWGVFIGSALDADDFTHIETALRQRVQAGPLLWKWKSVLFTAQ
ncbi:MAG: recombinase RarA, partial [Treponema sp.]|nr:recombinase RarA [Treponema sp.]